MSSVKIFDKLFYKCIKMSKNSLTKYYQDNKVIKKASQRYQNLYKEEKKCWLCCERWWKKSFSRRKITAWVSPYYNDKTLLPFKKISFFLGFS